ncbi:MAG TPA: GNAT family N-acetyltransferase [Solirubrobacterales bacterium]|nr:GNAT family N-acetyltransferase [Solirubrobacterales bacterium]
MGSPVATLSPLDSERFGIVVARADSVTAEALPQLLEFCAEHEVEMVIARCDGADVAAAKALTAAGMTALESQLIYRGSLRPRRDAAIRAGQPEDREAVAALAEAGFEQLVGHYHADPRLDPEACRAGYVEWTLRGLEGDAADAFFVYEHEGAVRAYGMFDEAGREATYILATVDPACRGMGLYTALLHHGMAWAEERGAEEIVGVCAHGNVAPQRNLLKAGMLPVATTTTFHGWRDQIAPGR